MPQHGRAATKTHSPQRTQRPQKGKIRSTKFETNSKSKIQKNIAAESTEITEILAKNNTKNE
jgi:hypothetical protein